MTWANCFSEVAGWTITGVSSVAVADVKTRYEAVDLPVFVPAFLGGGGGPRIFQPVGFALDQGYARLLPEYVLISHPLRTDAAIAMPDMIDQIEAIHVAAAADPMLNDNLRVGLTILQQRIGRVEWGGVSYWGVTFVMQWERLLT